ncbi:hypothetical protein Tco_1202108 [Tanacetum coccineum]
MSVMNRSIGTDNPRLVFQIVVRRAYLKEYSFSEADFSRLHLNDIEDMFLLYVQHKIYNLSGDQIFHLVIALRMFTRSIIIQKRVEDVQLRVESYQKKLNITKPQTKCEGISVKEPYTIFYKPRGVDVRDNLHDILQNFVLGYNKAMPTRKWSEKDQEWTAEMLKLIDDLLLERQIMRIFECYVGSRLNETDYRLRIQNWRDLPRDTPLVRVEVLRYDTKGVNVRLGKNCYRRRELSLEQTQHGDNEDALVNIKGVEELKRIVRIKGVKKEALHTLRQKPGYRMMVVPYSSRVEFIATCSYSINEYKDMMKAQVYVTQVFRYSDTQRLP